MRNMPAADEIYRHFKGNLYKIVTPAQDAEDGTKLIVYQALYGDYQVYVRSLEAFMSRVDKEKYPDAVQTYRFEKQNGVLGQMAQGQPEEKEKITAHAGHAQAGGTEGENGGLDPMLSAFLDADTYERKLDILSGMHSKITDEMINTMAASLEVEIGEGELETRYTSLKKCLLTLDRFECSRLR